MPEITYNLDGGMVNSRDDSQLDPEKGELTEAVGIWYKRGSGEAQMKKGRTAFVNSSIGTTNLSALYAEFTAEGAVSQFFARADTTLLRANAGLTASAWTSVSGITLLDTPLGLWTAFANDRYHFNDGVSVPWTTRWDTNTSAFISRATGMKPVSFQPTATAQISGSAQIIKAYAAAIDLDGSVPMPSGQYQIVNDNNKETFGTVTISANGDDCKTAFAKFRINSNLSDTTTATTEWAVEMTYEIVTTGTAKCTSKVEYCKNYTSASSAANRVWTTIENVNGAQAKHTVPWTFIAADGSIETDDIGIRLHVTKNNTASKGDVTVNIYDTRNYNTISAKSGGWSTTTGVYYWVTEKIDTEGIQSSISRHADGTPSISTLSTLAGSASGFSVTLPYPQTNPSATHYNLWRTTDGGVYPTGFLVATIPINATDTAPVYLDTSDPLIAPSSTTYGYFSIAGLVFDRDLPPPVATVMTTFQNVNVVAPVDEPNVLRYSAAGYPESYPLMNRIVLSSERDDTIYGVGVLGNVLGVFMHGRIRRVAHLPTPTDPTFGADPEDIATDHGVETRKGIAYLTPSNGEAALIAYVARDGIRVTDMYRSIVTTVNLDWDAIVDVSALSSSQIVNNSFYSRLEFFFTPTAAFRTAMAWPVNTKAVMWLSYVIDNDGQMDMSRLRCTFHPASFAWAFTAPVAGKDYTFMLSDLGGSSAAGKLFIDEVGDNDASLSFDGNGTIPRRITTGKAYIGPSKWQRARLRRLTVDRQTGSGNGAVEVTVGRDDYIESTTNNFTFVNVDGALSLIVNMSGQWIKCRYTLDSVSGTPPSIVSFAYDVDLQGAFV
jgi:hypothetical protein